MLMKLKDWPPAEDLKDYMPKRFEDLFQAFPMKDYTMRTGNLNLAGYLPGHCLKPELGPKMYIAYGSALYSGKASTNLHIDMSDAVNCLVYVGFPKDGNMEENVKQVWREIDKAGCDIVMKRRVRSKNALPGALWHIFHPKHTIIIRSFLNQVAIEKGKRLDPHDDPIHDQSTYLDKDLRIRLYKEYGIQGYTIVQCAGDTVFIPAGACHQVRNLHNCIKIAEDFVSPENISHCLHLTQEFRHLTEWHTNHEDKLQMKSFLFHSVKNAITVLKKSKRLR
jgi:lysine-specific demethylase 3